MDIKIVLPNIVENINEIRELIKSLADESDNFPFSSEDMNMSDEILKSFLFFLISSSNSILALAYIEKKLVGIGFLEGGKKNRTYHLANLGIGVLKKYHRCGIGTAIMNNLISYSKEGEYIAKIDIIVRQDNKGAIQLYKKNGFVVEGKSRRSLFIDGEFYDMLYMGRLVD